eukprot:6372673-Amphidinium_carterae.1
MTKPAQKASVTTFCSFSEHFLLKVELGGLGAIFAAVRPLLKPQLWATRSTLDSQWLQTFKNANDPVVTCKTALHVLSGGGGGGPVSSACLSSVGLTLVASSDTLIHVLAETVNAAATTTPC